MIGECVESGAGTSDCNVVSDLSNGRYTYVSSGPYKEKETNDHQVLGAGMEGSGMRPVPRREAGAS